MTLRERAEALGLTGAEVLDRLIEFIVSDMEPEEITAELAAEGVDLEKVRERLRECLARLESPTP